MEWTLLSTLKGGIAFRIKSDIYKWCIVLLSVYEQFTFLNDSNISGWLPILKMKYILTHVITINRYSNIYICILCNLPFAIDKEIPNTQNIIKEVFNISFNAAITAMLINKEVLTY